MGAGEKGRQCCTRASRCLVAGCLFRGFGRGAAWSSGLPLGGKYNLAPDRAGATCSSSVRSLWGRAQEESGYSGVHVGFPYGLEILIHQLVF